MSKRLISNIEFVIVYFIGKLFGISYVVKYLRNPNPLVGKRILECFGAKIGARTTIKRSIFLDNVYEDENSAGDFSHLEIGDNCYIGDCVYIDLSNRVYIGNNIVIAARANLVTHIDVNRSPFIANKLPRQCEPLRVGDGVFIGFGATVLHGVTIGENSVIASNCLLRESTEPHCIYAGVPGKRVKSLRK